MNRFATKLVCGLLIACVSSIYPTFCVRAQQIFIVFSHGVGSNGNDFSYLRQIPGVTQNSLALNFESKTTTLDDQASVLVRSTSTFLRRSSNADSKLIVVGHSQGGLRARWSVQKLGLGAKGLALIGTPNYGAAAAINYPTFIDQLTVGTAAAAVFSGFLIPVLPPLYGINKTLNESLKQSFGGPSLPQMRPGSDFIGQLNNVPTCTNRATSSTQQVLWVTKALSTPSVSCPSGSNPNFKPIPSKTRVMNIVGQNNSLDDLVTEFGSPKTVTFVAAAATTIAAGLWAANFFLGGALTGAALAVTTLAALMWSLQALWNAMIGSNRHDGLISEDSQELKNLRGIGGIFLPAVVLPTAVHSGSQGTTRNDKVELRSLRTRDALVFLQTQVQNNP